MLVQLIMEFRKVNLKQRNRTSPQGEFNFCITFTSLNLSFNCRKNRCDYNFTPNFSIRGHVMDTSQYTKGWRAHFQDFISVLVLNAVGPSE